MSKMEIATKTRIKRIAIYACIAALSWTVYASIWLFNNTNSLNEQLNNFDIANYAILQSSYRGDTNDPPYKLWKKLSTEYQYQGSYIDFKRIFSDENNLNELLQGMKRLKLTESNNLTELFFEYGAAHNQIVLKAKDPILAIKNCLQDHLNNDKELNYDKIKAKAKNDLQWAISIYDRAPDCFHMFKNREDVVESLKLDLGNSIDSVVIIVPKIKLNSDYDISLINNRYQLSLIFTLLIFLTLSLIDPLKSKLTNS
jgi:hypothetical protein